MANNNIVYTDQELAEAHIFQSDLTAEEKAKADIELKDLRMSRLKQLTDKQKLYADLLRLKFKMEDYIRHENEDTVFRFGVFLQEYLHILNKKQIDFANEINLHPTKLSQIISDKTNPNIALAYRLEKHSGGFITALLWWRLAAKKIEMNILNDSSTRKKEADKVLFELELY
jgi:plasmid maintenance system antidote protein VapI